MAEIIRIKDRLEKRPKRPVTFCEAKILLFTGVRYESYGDGAHPGKNGSKQARKR